MRDSRMELSRATSRASARSLTEGCRGVGASGGGATVSVEALDYLGSVPWLGLYSRSLAEMELGVGRDGFGLVAGGGGLRK